ncbi:unnamed protein product [Phytophthora fragariaefolia]|uniref:Unnamed protein product n=1 Tax=Phytophthora fragariaefolia TaxID=1490495 RepID=A0A9W7CNZ1_9STRA|nr:unnamed protein product [Phytophthora fragariaefolia]
MISSSRKNEARLEKPLRTSPEDETALTVVMSGVHRPRGTDIDGTVTTDTDTDMTVEWTTPVTHPDSSSEDVEDQSTDEDQSGSDYADPYHSDEHDRHVAAANDAERRTEAIGTYGRSENRGRRGDFPNRGLDRNSRQQGQDRRSRHFGGGENDERRNGEWNRGSSEDLVPSVTQTAWHDYQPENVIKLLSGERHGWWSDQKFDKRVRMRALVQGAVNDARTRILLDTGANVSVISERFTKQLRLREVRDHGRCMEIQGFTKGTMATTKRALAKVTLGWNQVYEYELWVMDHGVGVDVVPGTDFMIPAGVRLDVFLATARLPDDVEIPLIKTQRMADTREEGPHVPDGPTEVLTIPGHESRDYRPMRQSPTNETHELWVRRTKALLPKSSLTPVQETQISIRLKARSTNDGWQPNHRRWKVPYTTPTKILRRPSESSEGSVSDRDDQAERATATTDPSTEMIAEVVHQEEALPKLTAHSDRVSKGSEVTQLKLEGAYLAAATVSGDWGDRDAPNASEHLGNAIAFEDYARKLAFLPELTEAASTTLDYTGPHVRHPSLSVEQQDRVVKVLKSHERIMISSGNALPPPAYGVVCDIDVQEHPPIKPKARRIPLRHLKQLYELLKGLLKAGLIAFSDSPWASPIVIVLKKNGVDIRLCIDYELVNAVTAIMEYTMPLVDDLLTDMEKYLWYCSLYAASGFWAVMMTQGTRKISVFVCALGHFEWLRMPFGLKNAPMIYQRKIDNALWGFVQPRRGWSAFAERVQTAEAADTTVCGSPTDTVTHNRTRFEADRESSDLPDSLSAVVNNPRGDMFANGEADQSSPVPVFERRSFVDDICSGGESFDPCLETLERLLSRFEECRISVSFTKSMFVQATVDFLSHAMPRELLRADAKKLKAITELSFPKTKKGVQAFLDALNYYSRFIQDFAAYGAALYQGREEDSRPGGDLSTAKRSFTALQAKVADAPILKHFDRAKEVHVMLFANDCALSTTLMQEHDGVMHPVRFCGRVLKDNEVNYHPAEKEVLALLLLLKTCYIQLVGRTINAYTRFSTLGWINTSKTLFGRSTQFAVMLCPWHLVVHRVTEDDMAFAQLLHSTITNFVGLDTALQRVAPPSKRTPMVRINPALLYALLPNGHRSFVLSFDGSAKTPKHGGYGSCAWILWRLPDWKIEIAASAYLESTTVNQAEYMGMKEGVLAAQAYGVTDLVVVGASRLAIQQYLGVIACLKESLLTQLNIHRELVARFQSVRYLHVTREYNASADSLAGETLAAKEAKTTLTEESKSKLEQLNRIHEVIYQRPNRETAKKRVRFADTHDEDSEALPVEPEPPDRPNDVTAESSHVENGEISPGAAEQPPSAEDVDPLEVQEERRHRVGRAQDEELRWANLKLVLKGESSSLGYKAAPEAWKMADRFVLCDDDYINGFRHPTTEVSEGNTALLLFQCAFTGYVMAKAMSDTSALCVAQAFEECVCRRFGAPSLVRPDRDPRFMSKVFQTFAEMMQSRSRATLSYRPQAKGQQERSGKTVMQSVRVYAEDPLQQDWDEIVERLVFAINNSQDTTRKETPFYLVHGWDAQSTLKAMASSLKRGFGRQSDALDGEGKSTASRNSAEDGQRVSGG